MIKKYEFTGETKYRGTHKLQRIRALIDIPAHNVKAGDLGGWIENEHNLSHGRNAWVADNSCVFDGAVISGDALISKNVQVYDHAWITNETHVRGNGQIVGRVYL